jgi:hypothetical protein
MFEYFTFALPIAGTKLPNFLSTDNVNQNVLVLIVKGPRFEVALHPRDTGLTAKITATAAFFYKYRCAPVSTGNTFQDLLRLCETTDNTKHYT